jgi:hypothetical protein
MYKNDLTCYYFMDEYDLTCYYFMDEYDLSCYYFMDEYDLTCYYFMYKYDLTLTSPLRLEERARQYVSVHMTNFWPYSSPAPLQYFLKII